MRFLPFTVRIRGSRGSIFNRARCWKSTQVAISAARGNLAPLPAKVRNCGTGEQSPGGDCCAGPADSARKGQKVPFFKLNRVRGIKIAISGKIRFLTFAVRIRGPRGSIFNQARCWRSTQVAISAARGNLAPLPAKVRNCGTGGQSPGGDCCAGPADSARKGQKVPFFKLNRV